MAGKGDSRRPMAITNEEFTKRWEDVFMKKPGLREEKTIVPFLVVYYLCGLRAICDQVISDMPWPENEDDITSIKKRIHPKSGMTILNLIKLG